MDNQIPFGLTPQEQTDAHDQCRPYDSTIDFGYLLGSPTSISTHHSPPLNLPTTLGFSQPPQEPTSSRGLLAPWHHNPALMPGNISSDNMSATSLDNQYYCTSSYNANLPLQPSASTYQPYSLRLHVTSQQPLLEIESAPDIMLNSVPPTNIGAFHLNSLLHGTPLMFNTTLPLQNPTLYNYLYPSPLIGGQLLPQRQWMGVDNDLAPDISHSFVHQTQSSQLHSQQHHSFYPSNSFVINKPQVFNSSATAQTTSCLHLQQMEREEMRVTNILFTPPASPLLISGGIISQEQTATQELSLTSRKRGGSDNRDQRGCKRPKRAIQLQKKLEIIGYWEQNQSISFQLIGDRFGLPRTTIFGIVKEREILQGLVKSKPRASLTMETSRMVEPQFRILEEVLMAWITDLHSRRVPLSGRKITGQAFDIHRMLSGQLVEPLPPCQFSSGWLKNFKSRRGISLQAMHHDAIASDDVERAFKEVHDQIVGYPINHIYTCDVTSMYLNAIPTAVFQEKGQNHQAKTVDSASVSVLFCGNADGSDKREPLVLVRHLGGIFEIEGYRSVVLDAGVGDMTASVFRQWITEFDKTLNHRVVLLVDEIIWRLLKTVSGVSKTMVGKVEVIRMPIQLHSLLPMAAGVTKELKANYYVQLTKKRKSTKVRTKNITGKDYMNLIAIAWSRVPESTFERTFQRFITSSRSVHPPNFTGLDLRKSMAVALLEALKNIYSEIPDSVLQYYLSQDNDMGPSRFLRAKIQEMHRHEDFGRYFGTPKFGVVIFGSVKSNAVGNRITYSFRISP